MFVCQDNEGAGDVSPPVETHHLGFHIPIGSLKQRTQEKLIPAQELDQLHWEFCTTATQSLLLAPPAAHISSHKIPA